MPTGSVPTSAAVATACQHRRHAGLVLSSTVDGFVVIVVLRSRSAFNKPLQADRSRWFPGDERRAPENGLAAHRRGVRADARVTETLRSPESNSAETSRP
jgi:hypothetical protein